MWSGLAALSAMCLGGVTAYEGLLWLQTGYWAPLSFRFAWISLFGSLPYWAWWDADGLILRATELPLTLWLAAATLLFVLADLRSRKGLLRKRERQRRQGFAARFRARRQR